MLEVYTKEENLMPRETKEAKELNKVVSKEKVAVKKTKTSVNVEAAISSPKKVKKATVKKNNLIQEESKKFVDVLEYYDLPYRYNETVVKVLSQTPKTLFVYWDIADKDRKKFIKNYGKDFFEATIPILIIHNKTDNYFFEIEINDFANSWYFSVEHENCEYFVELGRRFKDKTQNMLNQLLHLASSNEISSPNDHILFEKNMKTLNFKNIKTGLVSTKDIDNLRFAKSREKIYNIYDLYRKIYKSENILNLNNPSSGNPTSTF